MKKIIYFLLALLMVLPATAQDADVVTPPENLQLEEYALQSQLYQWEEFTPVTMPLMIGFDNNDVYLQGLCDYLPTSWVKGTRNGNTITLPTGQFLGLAAGNDDNYYPMFFCGVNPDEQTTDDVALSDIVLTIDEQGNMSTNSWFMVSSSAEVTEGTAAYMTLTSNSILKLEDKAATPANPTIVEFMPYTVSNGYAGLSMDIPTTDVNGEPLMTSKLYYKIYTDIEKDIQPMLFPADEHNNIDEDMTEIPYRFTDDYDIVYGGYAAYWYHDTKNFNRIGVQTIYRGGNEEHTSEIVWLDIKPYAGEGTVFDFNALDKETTPVSNKSHDGDITEDLVLQKDYVTLTVTPSGANTPNRYWVDYNLDAIQLRLYGGSMTFEVPEGCTIEKIFFNGEWNPYNEFDSGEMDNNQVWTGSTQKLVVYFFSGGSTGNSKINSIAVVAKGTTGVSVLTQQSATVLRTFDLQGRELPGDAKGLVIQQLRTSDGHVITKKVLRK